MTLLLHTGGIRSECAHGSGFGYGRATGHSPQETTFGTKQHTKREEEIGKKKKNQKGNNLANVIEKVKCLFGIQADYRVTSTPNSYRTPSRVPPAPETSLTPFFHALIPPGSLCSSSLPKKGEA